MYKTISKVMFATGVFLACTIVGCVMLMGIGGILAALYLLYREAHPVVYPAALVLLTAAMFIGSFIFYWLNDRKELRSKSFVDVRTAKQEKTNG